MRNKILIILGVLVVMGAIAGGIVYANLDTAIKLAEHGSQLRQIPECPGGYDSYGTCTGLQRR